METDTDALILLERLARLLQNDAHRHGLKPTQWEVLRYLGRANRFSRSPGAVTAYLGMTKGTVSQTLAALERKGLLEKVPNPKDRRNVTTRLTRQGRSMLKKDPLADLDAAADVLGEQQMKDLDESLRRLLGEALRRRNGRPFGVCRSCRHFQRYAEDGKPHRCGLLKEPLSATDSGQICVEQEPAAPAAA